MSGLRKPSTTLPVIPRPVGRGSFGALCAPLSVLVLAALVLAGCRHQPAPSVFQPFDFVQMCDPQLGFTEYAADLRRFDEAVSQINALRPDLVLICGDLVNRADEKSFADFNAAKARFTIPAYAAPGNHDLGNRPTLQSLEQYRRLVGPDYYAVDHEGCRFVVLNSQLWQTPVAGETDKQDAWLAQTMETAAKQHRRLFVVMHHPLFVKAPDEPDEYFNLPRAKRKELLALFERCSVVAVLTGHTHTTVINEYHGMQMVTSENTSRNFDKHPLGFRLWHVAAQRPYRNEFVPLAGQ